MIIFELREYYLDVLMDGSFSECYVVHREKAVVLKAEAYTSADKETIKLLISEVIEKLRT